MDAQAPSFPMQDPVFEVVEDVWEPCPCAHLLGGPTLECYACLGTGYRITKRTTRPVKPPSRSEQALEAIIRTQNADLLKAAATLEHAAHLLAGKTTESQQTRGAAKALRERVEGQG